MNDPKNNEICPMTGQPCSHPKVIHMTELLSNGDLKNADLCYNCGGKTMLNIPVLPKVEQHSVKYDSAKMLVDFLNFVSSKSPGSGEKTWDRSPCPECGWTLGDINHVGRLGCAKCYVWFHAELRSVLMENHAGCTKHVGKVPKEWAKRQEEIQADCEKLSTSQDQLERLEYRMAEAIKTEDYEAAATIRDAIKNLKNI